MIYEFKDVNSMISLAREIQSKVYWGTRFYLITLPNSNSISYKEFWDYVRAEVSKGAIGVSIKEDDIEFIYKKVSDGDKK